MDCHVLNLAEVFWFMKPGMEKTIALLQASSFMSNLSATLWSKDPFLAPNLLNLFHFIL